MSAPAAVALGSSPQNTWQVNASTSSWIRNQRLALPLSVPAKPRPLTLDLARTALVVVDMQNDFCHPAGWLASIGVDISPACRPVEPIAALLPVLRAVQVPVIWLNWGNRPDRINLSPSHLHVYNPDGASVGLGEVLPTSPQPSRVLQAGQWGAALVEGLVPATGDLHIDKFRMSGFYDTCLDAALRNMQIQSLLFAGVNADQCVLATLMDANFLGYDCLLLEDCTATTSPTFCWDATLYNVRQCFGFTALSSDLRSGLT